MCERKREKPEREREREREREKEREREGGDFKKRKGEQEREKSSLRLDNGDRFLSLSLTARRFVQQEALTFPSSLQSEYLEGSHTDGPDHHHDVEARRVMHSSSERSFADC